MNSTATNHRSVFQILDDGVQVLRDILPVAVFGAALVSFLQVQAQNSSFFWILASLVFQYFEILATELALKRSKEARSFNLKEALPLAIRRLGVVDTLRSILLLLWMAVLTFLLTLLLIIPGLVYYVNRALSLPILLAEDVTIFGALARSKDLMTRSPWYSLTSPTMRISVIMTLLPIFGICLSIGSALMTAFVMSGPIGIAQLVLGTAASIVTNVFFIYVYLVYFEFYIDLRRRAGEI